MSVLRLPGLIDPHVHVRDFSQAHKETWDTASQAALAGGVVTILAMPNTQPALVDAEVFDRYRILAARESRCDFAVHAGGNSHNARDIAQVAERASGLKLYLDATFGDLKMAELDALVAQADAWPKHKPLLVHAEERTMAAALLIAYLANRSVHVCHVSLRSEIELIARAKDRGVQVTCEVCPHHLFETADGLAQGFCEVRPRLATAEDRAALWANLAVIDCFATDHAPHLPSEKRGEKPPPGFPGLETALPLYLTALHEGRLDVATLEDKTCHAPRRIFHAPLPPNTYVEVDAEARYELRASAMHSRAGWTPFEGMPVFGRIERVLLRGEIVFEDGNVLAARGAGNEIFT